MSDSSATPIWRTLWTELIATHDRDYPPHQPAEIAARWNAAWPALRDEFLRNGNDEMVEHIEAAWADSAPVEASPPPTADDLHEPLANEPIGANAVTRDVYIQINAAQAWQATGNYTTLAPPYDFYFECNTVLPRVTSLELVQFKLPPRSFQTIGNVFGSNFCVLAGNRDWTRALQFTWQVPSATYTPPELINALNRAVTSSSALLRGTLFATDVNSQLTSLTLGFARRFGPPHFRFEWTNVALAQYLGLRVIANRPLADVVGQFVLPPTTDSDQFFARFTLTPDNATVTVRATDAANTTLWTGTISLLDTLDTNRTYSRAVLEQTLRDAIARTPWLLAPRSQLLRETSNTTALERFRWILVPDDLQCADVATHSGVRWTVQFPSESAIWTGVDSAFGFARQTTTLGTWYADDSGPLSDASLLLPSTEDTVLTLTPLSPEYRAQYALRFAFARGTAFANLDAMAASLRALFAANATTQQSAASTTRDHRLQLSLDVNLAFRMTFVDDVAGAQSMGAAPTIALSWYDSGRAFAQNPFLAAPAIVSATDTVIQFQGALILQGSGYIFPANVGWNVRLLDRNLTDVLLVGNNTPQYVDGYKSFLTRWQTAIVQYTDADGARPFQRSTIDVLSVHDTTATYLLTLRLSKSFTENDFSVRFEGAWWTTWLGWVPGTEYALNNGGEVAATLTSPKVVLSAEAFQVLDATYVWGTLTVDRATSVGLWGASTNSPDVSTRRWPLTLPVGRYTASTLIAAINQWMASIDVAQRCSLQVVGDAVTSQRFVEWHWEALEAELRIDDFEVVFYDLFWTPPSQCNAELFRDNHMSSPTSTLGWMLGFHRLTRYALDGTSIAQWRDANGVLFVRLDAESTIVVQSFQYAILVLDDFVLNKQGTTIVTAANPTNQKTMSASDHLVGLRRVCQTTTMASIRTNPLLYPANLMTQAQLYAAGMQAADVRAGGDSGTTTDEGTATIVQQRLTSFQNSNLIGMIPLAPDVTQETFYDTASSRGGSQSMFRRTYLAPTSLTRFRVQLFTELGNYLPLQNNQWQCVLLAKCLTSS